eukprot:jgi/Picsp_1/4047/NSC_01558-R1_---NA---
MLQIMSMYRNVQTDQVLRPRMPWFLAISLVAVILYQAWTKMSHATSSVTNVVSRGPLVFYHVMRTGGTSFRRELYNSALVENLDTFLPGPDGVPSHVSSHLDALMECSKLGYKKARLARCLVTKSSVPAATLAVELRRLSCAKIIGFHFGPFALDHVYHAIVNDLVNTKIFAHHPRPCTNLCLEKQTCIVLLRDPYSRLVSHYYHFMYKNQSFQEDVKENGVRAVWQSSGEEPYMNILANDINKHTLEDVLVFLDRCHVGTYERREEFLGYLSAQYQGLHIRPDTHLQADDRTERTLQDNEFAKMMFKGYFPNDEQIYEYAQRREKEYL